MTKANGTEWLNVCVGCGVQKITHGTELPGQCAKCHGWRWLCHLEIPHNNHRHRNNNKILTQKVSNRPETRNQPTRDLCNPIKSPATPKLKACQGSPGRGQGRGRPQLDVPEGLIKKLAKKGYGAKSIARQLGEQGIVVSYQTVLRRLQGALL